MNEGLSLYQGNREERGRGKEGGTSLKWFLKQQFSNANKFEGHQDKDCWACEEPVHGSDDYIIIESSLE